MIPTRLVASRVHHKGTISGELMGGTIMFSIGGDGVWKSRRQRIIWDNIRYDKVYGGERSVKGFIRKNIIMENNITTSEDLMSFKII